MASGTRQGQSKPIPVLDVDISTPIDTKKAIEGLGGSERMYYGMLEKFEDMSLIQCMNQVKEGVEMKNF